MPEISVGISDDYAALEVGSYTFYYGYEHTTCKEHGDDSNCDCNDWCFVVIVERQIVYRLSEDNQEEDYPLEGLVMGIGSYLGNIGLPGQLPEPSRKELLKEAVINMNRSDLYQALCEAEGVSEEEAVERIMKAVGPNTVEALLKQHGYRT